VESKKRTLAIQPAILAEKPTAAPRSPAVIARADHSILQRHTNAIAALLAEILSANNARPTPGAAMRIHRMIRS
jgi:hypothetical protein